MSVQKTNLEKYVNYLLETNPDIMTAEDISENLKLSAGTVLNHKYIFNPSKVGASYVFAKNDVIEAIERCYRRAIKGMNK